MASKFYSVLSYNRFILRLCAKYIPKSEKKSLAEYLDSKGLELIELEEPVAALKVAKRLYSLRWSGAFELEAKAHLQLGDLETAIETLEKGVDKVPGVYGLWELLGNYLSDNRQYEQADKAYEKAALANNPDLESLNLNRSILYERMGDLSKACSVIQPILDSDRLEQLDPPLQVRLLSQKCGLLNALDKPDEAIRFFEAIDNKGYGDDCGEELSWLWCHYAEALHMLGQQSEAIIAALGAVRFDTHNKRSLWWLREIRKQSDQPPVNWYRITFESDDVSQFEGDVEDLEGYLIKLRSHRPIRS